MSLRAHLEQVAKATGKAPPALVGEYALPEALAHVWGWFCELSGARGAGGFSIAPISFQDIEAWARLTGHQPTPAEVVLLRQLDDVFRDELSPK
ncbi:hypothetical protein LXT21_44465 [Myxococcus sp. K38C18041901]|uniref:phage tail assembly chaperone n=1 Tax=Myxococcus guangdongensis TaxID=2906760 RepID=UPI0020A71D5A|nr:hypothetical protein [Myxococcus guangdongensis]MCP3065845.1 hypothetical protein [Myxococcus guangdongensis]